MSSPIRKITLLLIPVFVLLLTGGCNNKKKVSDSENTDTLANSLTESFSKFPFVGMAYGNPSIYVYDFATKKIRLLWYHPYDFVIALSTNYQTNVSFFVTARKIEKKADIPSIKKIKLFRINSSCNSTGPVSGIGSGIQIYAHWNDDGNFEIIHTEVDKKIASNVNRYTKVYSSSGSLIDDNIEIFDIIKDGYPELTGKPMSTISVSGKYGVTLISDSVFFRSVDDDSLKFITMVKGKLKDIKWSVDEKFIFFTTFIDLKSSGSGKLNDSTGLFIYNDFEDLLTVKWISPGRKYFFILNNYLIFEDGFGSKSVIRIYDFRKAEMFDIISLSGGAGLINIPLNNTD